MYRKKGPFPIFTRQDVSEGGKILPKDIILYAHDKLKQYKICINSIDGFSCKIIWLSTAFTNSDLKVIGGYFAVELEHHGGCPTLIQTDIDREFCCERHSTVSLEKCENIA